MKIAKGSCIAVILTCTGLFSGCATQTPPVQSVESGVSLSEQREAQARAVREHDQGTLNLKRKIALGRITNETSHGRSLLRDSHDDVLGKQVTDILSKALTESGKFLVFERPDISRIQAEQALTAQEINLVGVDTLIIGSLTEFGRSTTGERGFWSDSKRQRAYAKVDLRLVDTRTGLVYFSTSGAGEATTESASVAGFGSRAAYDGTLNDMAIRIAVNDAIDRLSGEMMKKPWQTDILEVSGGDIFISGGQSQGIRPGMEFDVRTKGRRVRSEQTGFEISLPGQVIASVKVLSTFGNTEPEEGSIVALTSGSMDGYAKEDLIITEKD